MNKEKILNSKKSGVFGANLFVLIIMVLYIAFSMALTFIAPKIPNTLYSKIMVSFVLPQVIILLGSTIVYLKITKKSFKKVLRLNKVSGKSLLIILGIFICIYPVLAFANLLSLYIFPSMGVAIQNTFSGIPLVVKLCVIALMPAIFEEITMRGVALSGYDGISIGKSAIVIGFFFGTLHRNGNQFAYAFIMGIVFAYIVRITNSIIPSMICHFVYNGFSTVLAHFIPQKATSTDPTAMIDMATIISLSVITAICVMIIILLIRKLAEVNNYSDERQVENFKRENNITGKIKIFNWPFIGVIIMCVYSIGLELVRLYLLN
ncbi:type II CAAX endopeptidase family protein [Clostridium oceanicum]|uniref:Type II CAAX endopeptidase family protein n=1 Tax=Clostridium oceanicum TaxID=1543 RepID=A0ABP3UME2_9CLOT